MGRGAESNSLIHQIPMPHVSHGMADEPIALKFRHAALYVVIYVLFILTLQAERSCSI